MSKEELELSRQISLLAEALHNILINFDIVNAQTSVSGPELLMATSDLLDCQKWTKNPPDQQCLWWWWDEDPDSEPIPVSILESGTNNEYFASIGQHGWNRAQWVKEMGGVWMKVLIPKLKDVCTI